MQQCVTDVSKTSKTKKCIILQSHTDNGRNSFHRELDLTLPPSSLSTGHLFLVFNVKFYPAGLLLILSTNFFFNSSGGSGVVFSSTINLRDIDEQLVLLAEGKTKTHMFLIMCFNSWERLQDV